MRTLSSSGKYEILHKILDPGIQSVHRHPREDDLVNLTRGSGQMNIDSNILKNTLLSCNIVFANSNHVLTSWQVESMELFMSESPVTWSREYTNTSIVILKDSQQSMILLSSFITKVTTQWMGLLLGKRN